MASDAQELSRSRGDMHGLLAGEDKPTKRQGRFGRYQATRRGEMVAVDVLSITPASSNDRTKVLVISDALTRYTWVVVLPGETSQLITEVLVDLCL